MAIAHGVLYGVLAMLGYGFADLFVALVTEDESVMQTLFWSRVVATAVLGGVLAAFFSVSPVSMTAAGLLLGAGVLQTVAYLAFYTGIKKSKLSVVSPVASAWGAATVVLGVLVLGEVLTRVQLAAIAVIVIGTVLVSFRQRDLIGLQWKNYEIGAIYGGIALLSWGGGFAIIDVLVADIGWIAALFLLNLVIAVYLLGYKVVRGDGVALPGRRRDIGLVGVFEAGAYVAVGIGISQSHAAVVAPVAAAFPVVTVILAHVVLDEAIDHNQWVGVLAIVAGVVALAL